jgi:hypothetical protein
MVLGIFIAVPIYTLGFAAYACKGDIACSIWGAGIATVLIFCGPLAPGPDEHRSFIPFIHIGLVAFCIAVILEVTSRQNSN